MTIIIEKDFVKLTTKDSSYGWVSDMYDVVGAIGQVRRINDDEYLVEFTERGNGKLILQSSRIRNGFTTKGVDYALSLKALKLIISQEKFQKRIDKIQIGALNDADQEYVANVWEISLGKTPLNEPLHEIFKKLNNLYRKSVK